MIFSSIDCQLKHLWTLDWIRSPIPCAEFIFVIWEYFAFSKITDGDLEIVLGHVAEVHLGNSYSTVARGFEERLVFSYKRDQDVVTL